VLGLLGAGTTFGKTAVMLGAPSQLDVVALGDTMLVAIRASCVLAMIERNLRFSRNLALALAERNQALLAELERPARLPSAQRLAAYLDSIAEPTAEPGRFAGAPCGQQDPGRRPARNQEGDAVASVARVRKRRADRGFGAQHRHPRRRCPEADRGFGAGRLRAGLIWINRRLGGAATLA
jgi:CRP-like cAMP-binding protein